MHVVRDGQPHTMSILHVFCTNILDYGYNVHATNYTTLSDTLHSVIKNV